MSQYEGFMFDAQMALEKVEYALTQVHAFHMCPSHRNDQVFEMLNKAGELRRAVQQLESENDKAMKEEDNA